MGKPAGGARLQVKPVLMCEGVCAGVVHLGQYPNCSRQLGLAVGGALDCHGASSTMALAGCWGQWPLGVARLY